MNFLVILAAILTGNFTFPLPDWLQTFGGIISFLFPPLLVVLAACMQPPLRKRRFTAC